MCGICGIVNWQDSIPDPARLVRMRDIMQCRGPDDAGIFTAPGIALGHRRLSIIDLSEAGHQPMCNEDRTIWCVFNGEIYNFLDLRPELEQAGHVFSSQTDTEVLIHGYEEWGLDGLIERVRGMFAIAIWDGRQRTVHLLRDHLGKKPLFYYFECGTLLFSSDIKSIWVASANTLEINEKALDEYLYYYFISQSRTIYKQVYKLPPASYATFGGDDPQIRRYWTPSYADKKVKTRDEWLDGIDEHFRIAVRRRLIADVPLGAFLSGGVDSSCVCAVLTAESTERPKTFTVGFNQSPAYDERLFSRRVADHIGSDHRELLVEQDVWSILPNIVWHFGEPYGDSSAIPMYLIAKAASKHVSVVLTGDGGDESFAGYRSYLAADRARHWAWVPSFIRGGLGRSVASLALLSAPASLLARRMELFVKYFAGDMDALAQNNCWWDGLRKQLYTTSWVSRLGGWHPVDAQRDLLQELNGPTQLDNALQYVLMTRLPSDYLTKIDVATMAHGLEARSPFLDIDLLEFAMTVPAEHLVAGRQLKSLLKRYAEQIIPREVIYRPKQGFELPLEEWFRGKWYTSVKRLLLSTQAVERGYFDPEVIRRVLEEHLSHRFNHTARLWTLVVFEVWNRLFVDRTLSPGDSMWDHFDT